MVNINEENKETNLNNNEDNDKSKSLVTIILGVVLGMSFLYFAFIQPQVNYLIYSLLLASLVFMVIEPLVKLIIKSNKGEHVEFKEIVKIIVYSILLVAIFINSYEIFNSGEEFLHLNYQIVSILIAVFVICLQYKNIKKIIKDNKKGKKGWRIAGSLFMFALSIVMFIFPNNKLFVEHKTLDISRLGAPDSITINKVEEHKSYNTSEILESLREDKEVTIKDEKLIMQLVSELQAKKLDNLRGFEYFDYSIKNDNRYPHYSIYLDYGSKLKTANNESFRIYFIDLYEDGLTLIDVYDREIKEALLYKTHISNELTKKIIAELQKN
ncbi:hypothetical protein [Sporosalibacterium faouarense]|uniref:hypothetical protein n=1 Tax=Sporosalibacterium faouarense TaxID=516123 RepID=UPI00192CAF62|nr:hypothetical protein [Sporosalibacterium faouarense]